MRYPNRTGSRLKSESRVIKEAASSTGSLTQPVRALLTTFAERGYFCLPAFA